MKTITMYELLGMVKDGKAPKTIKYMGYNFKYNAKRKRYERYFDEQIWTLNNFVNVDNSLNDEVDILEEEILEEEKKMPEKLTQFEAPFLKGDKPDIRFSLIINQINEIIDYIKSKGDE